MSKFCTSCGSEMDDASVFCPNCGASCAEAPKSAKPAAKANDFVEKTTAFTRNYINEAKKDPKKLIIPAVAVVAAIVVIVLICVLAGSGYKRAVSNFMDVTYKGKISKVEKLAPKDYWDYLEDENDFDLSDYKDEMEENYEDMMDNLEDEYGENVRISYKITDKDTLSDKKLKDLKDELKDSCDIAKKDVKKAYKVDIELKIKGKEDNDEVELEDYYIAKIGSGWYLLSPGMSFMVP